MSDPNPPSHTGQAADPLVVVGRPRGAVRRPLAFAGVLVLVALVGTWVFARSSSSEDATYRTATVGAHEVEATIDRVATVEPVSQAAVSFPVSGTVSSVAVKVGDTVTTGQPLASLDTTTLQSTLVDKQAALAEAQLTLDKELNGEKVGGSGSARSATSGSGSSSGSPSATGASSAAGSTPVAVSAVATVPAFSSWSDAGSATPVATSVGTSTGPTDDALRQARQAIVDAQKAVTAASAAASAALDQASAVCAAIGSTDAHSSASADSGSAVTTTAASPSDAVAACKTATQAVLDAQASVSQQQQQVTAASDAYSALLDQRAGSTQAPANGDTQAPSGSTDTTPEASGDTARASGGATSGTATDGSGGSGGSGSSHGTSPTTSGSGGSGAATTTAPSAADLIADQKAVDAAEAAVAVAQQALAQASMVSPIDGTVVSVGFQAGSSITAGSSTETIVVVGDGGYEVSTTVSVADLPKVKVGQSATITPDGSSTQLSGQVVRIGVSPSSTTDATYPVVIAITERSAHLRNGATASVSIVTNAADKVLAVPTSAVSRQGGRATVQVLVNGTPSEKQVTVGTIGREWIQIDSGLRAGDVVVLADLSQALPGSATSGSTSGASTTGGGRFGQGGFGGFGPPDGGAAFRTPGG